jgi:hypothetical protein
MMRALTVTLLLVSSLANAQTRPDVRVLNCGQASSLVRANGAIVLGTGAHTYDRYVSSARFCPYPQVTRPAWIATSDEAQCFVGYLCADGTQRFSR